MDGKSSTMDAVDAVDGVDGVDGVGVGVGVGVASLPRARRYSPEFEAHIFRPGHTVQPSAEQRGAGKAAQYRAAIVNGIPPAQIVTWLEWAAATAVAQRSPKGMVAVVELALAYGIGKPRAMADDGAAQSLGDLLAAIRGIADDDDRTVRSDAGSR